MAHSRNERSLPPQAGPGPTVGDKPRPYAKCVGAVASPHPTKCVDPATGDKRGPYQKRTRGSCP